MTLGELAEALGAELKGGDPSAEVLGIAGLEEVGPGQISYVQDARLLRRGEATPALALIAPEDCASEIKPLLSTADPRLAFAHALRILVPAGPPLQGVHPTAVIGEDVALGEGAAVGAHAVVGDGARLGARVQIHPLAIVGRGAQIGDDSIIHPHVTLYEGVRLGARVIVHAGSVVGSAGFGYVEDGEKLLHIPHVGTVVIEDEVEIGAGVTIDRATTGATVIGRGTKIDNLVHVAHNVKIGRNCVVAGQTGFSGSVTLGDGVVLAGQTGVADHVTVGRGAKAGARAAITRDIPDGVTVLGNPARPLGEQLRIEAALGKLPELRREMRKLAARIAALERARGGKRD